MKFLEIELSVKSKLSQVSFAVNQRRSRRGELFEFEDGCIDEEKEEQQDMWKQFLKSQKINY